MTADPLSTWLGFLTSPAAPKGVMSPMELDGYLTGIVVSPDLLPPSHWLDRIWGENEPTFDGLDEMRTVIAAVMDHYNAISAALDAGFKQIEAKKPTDYRPLYLAASEKPNHDIVRTWVRGFGKAMAVAPERWSTIAEDERLQPLLTPFIGFLDVRPGLRTSRQHRRTPRRGRDRYPTRNYYPAQNRSVQHRPHRRPSQQNRPQ
jgi:uncharacterized protein